MSYGDAARRIPAAAITIEDAERIERLTAAGRRVVVRLTMGARDEGLVPSANVVAELVGRERPDEFVVIGGHLDSWDVGQGAQDDGGGCVMAIQAIALLRRLDLVPRRTIRVVLWTNEENGGAGAKQYVKDHEAELARHVAAIESDNGTFAPLGFHVDCEDDAAERRTIERLAELLAPLGAIGAIRAEAGSSEADVAPMRPRGVPTLGLWVDTSHYFDFHHTPADTFDKVDRESFRRCLATMAVAAYSIAESPGRLDRD